MPTHTCNALLLKCAAACPHGTAQRWHEALTDWMPAPTVIQSAFTPQAENGLPMQHVYLRLAEPTEITARNCASLEATWHALTGQTAQISRLHEVMHLETPQHEPRFGAHYVVETDPEQGWEDEIFKWYDQEHLPGLARVPGCKVARRYINLDHAPRSFACYDLTSPAVLNSDPWLAVRGTAWSDICRPHFTNTRRTMFQNQEPHTHD